MRGAAIRWVRAGLAGLRVAAFVGFLGGGVAGCGEEDIEVGGEIPPPVAIPTETPDTGNDGEEEF
ncbi:MAG: hypothetical protein KatS3mg076_0836 [Candidatus Binatia bacterium]|nr:MAG: hypothetical protein KatS3mg076_0836 [Candidatus Binatia bacterium]